MTLAAANDSFGALAGKTAEAFAHSRDVAARHRQVAMKAVGNLIEMNVEQMQAARNKVLLLVRKLEAPGS